MYILLQLRGLGQQSVLHAAPKQISTYSPYELGTFGKDFRASIYYLLRRLPLSACLVNFKIRSKLKHKTIYGPDHRNEVGDLEQGQKRHRRGCDGDETVIPGIGDDITKAVGQGKETRRETVVDSLQLCGEDLIDANVAMFADNRECTLNGDDGLVVVIEEG